MNPWLLAARPKTLPAAVVPVAAGAMLAHALTGQVALALVLCALAGSICIQIATNFFNDALDHRKGADTAARLGPTRVTASGLLSARAVMVLGALFLAAACAFSVPTIAARGWAIVAIGLPSLYFAFGYTGGPWPLAYRGLGELFVLLFFGLVAVSGTVFVATGQWWWGPSLWLGLQVGFLSTALIAINNMRDVAEDRTTGKNTLAVRFGEGFARAEIAVCCVAPLTMSLGWRWLAGWSWWCTLPLLLLPLALFLSRSVAATPPGRAYNRFLALAGVQLLAFGLLFSLAAVLR